MVNWKGFASRCQTVSIQISHRNGPKNYFDNENLLFLPSRRHFYCIFSFFYVLFFFFHFVRHFFFVPSFLMKFPLVIQAVAHFGLLLLSHFLFLLIFIDLNSSKLTYHLNPTACECPLKCPINYLF